MMTGKDYDAAVEAAEHERIERISKWVRGEGTVTLHPTTHPKADLTPRDALLVAIDEVAPEVGASLRELQPLYDEALKDFEKQKGGKVLLPKYWYVLGATEDLIEEAHTQGDDTSGYLKILELRQALQAWAERWHLDEQHWTKRKTWMLDHALLYLQQRCTGYFPRLPSTFESTLSEHERLVKAFDVIPESAHSSEAALAAYKKLKLEEFEALLDRHLQKQRDSLEQRLGAAGQKRTFAHFLVTVLSHVSGYGPHLIQGAYDQVRFEDKSDLLKPDFGASPVSIREGINDVCDLVKLIPRKLPKGRPKTEVAERAKEEIIARLDLRSLLPPQPV